MSKDFQGKTAIITGGASGIGKEAVLAFASKGANVVVADTKEKAGNELALEVKNNGGNAIFVRTDVTILSDTENLVKEALNSFKTLDFAFNNAGITSNENGRVADKPEESWLKVIDVNLNGVFRCMKYQLPVMLEQKSGVIVNNASVLAQVGFKGTADYCAAKHGVIGLTKTAALEYASKGIRINALCPGFVDTPMVAKMGIHENEKVYKSLLDLHPAGRLGNPSEIAKAVVWLCSDDASFVNGASFVIDGGFLAR
jgi:NAD(P)-dependent dehydrogenase (short-subunit alcohol dehydrogenase family)